MEPRLPGQRKERKVSTRMGGSKTRRAHMRDIEEKSWVGRNGPVIVVKEADQESMDKRNSKCNRRKPKR